MWIENYEGELLNLSTVILLEYGQYGNIVATLPNEVHWCITPITTNGLNKEIETEDLRHEKNKKILINIKKAIGGCVSVNVITFQSLIDD